MFSKKEREYYNISRQGACDRLGITKNSYNWLRREGDALHRIYEWQCNGVDDNGYSSEKTQARWDRWENEHYSKIKKYTADLGLFVYFQTDPRGATIYIDNEEIPNNNYTHAVCIY